MHTADFDYQLPVERIAQRPASPRDSSRLMLLDRSSGKIQHLRFHDLPKQLRPEDALVLNETRVIPARITAAKSPGGGAVELLLLTRRSAGLWEVMVGGKGLRPGRRVQPDHGPQAEIVEDLGGPRRLVRFEESISDRLPQIGVPPLPPYIHQPLQSPEEYQTVYAQRSGSVAAPTAGLHFTQPLLDQIAALGVRLLKVTLHIGLDTFAPVTEAEPRAHAIHSEWCEVPPPVIESIEQVHAIGGRVIAVGTTSVRALESAAQAASPGKSLVPFEGATNLFILPGYEFKLVDAMLTNFHLPRSTLLMMVSAFGGLETILHAYQVAIKYDYRFYSFGDAMLIT